MLKQILAQIRPGDWFASVDLKDAYFHIQIAPHHRRFLRFAFEGTAYQYSVLPFGLALAPRTFSKCMDAALSPLRASGIRILNYLDDWLILAQSQDTLLSHIDSLLIHLESLGLCVNMRKSILAPSQSITYLGVCMDSLEMRARLSRERAAAILSYLRHFREGQLCSFEEISEAAGTHGVSFGSMSSWLITHATTAAMAEILESPGQRGLRDVWVSRSPTAALKLWRRGATRISSAGESPGLGSFTRGGHNRRIDARLGSGVRGNASFGTVVGTSDPMAHKPLGIGKQSF